jgi:hypothetical protein
MPVSFVDFQEIHMFKRTLMATLLIGSSATAFADPGIFFGVTYAFGQTSPGVGVSLKVMSTDKEDHAAVGAGVTYYPLLSSNPFGVDVDVGYLFKNSAVTVGWDFLHSPQVGVGYVNTWKASPAPAPAPVLIPG